MLGSRGPLSFISGLREDLGLQDADVGEVAVGTGVVEPVAHDELVRHLEAEVLHVELHPPPRGLTQKRADLQRGRPASEQRAADVGEGEPRVYYVLDDQDVAVGYVLLEVLEDADHAARGGTRAVGAYVHEVDLARQVYVAHEVAQDHDRPAQDAHQERPLAPVVLGDELPHLAHLLLYLGGGYEHLFHVGHHAGHLHGIVSTSSLSTLSVVSSTLNPSPSSPRGIQATSPRALTTTGVRRRRSFGTFRSIIARRTFLVPPRPNGRIVSPSRASRTRYGPRAASR